TTWARKNMMPNTAMMTPMPPTRMIRSAALSAMMTDLAVFMERRWRGALAGFSLMEFAGVSAGAIADLNLEGQFWASRPRFLCSGGRRRQSAGALLRL